MPVAVSKIGPTVVTAPASIMESDDMRTRDHHLSRCLAVSALPISRTFVSPTISAQNRFFHACLVIKWGLPLTDRIGIFIARCDAPGWKAGLRGKRD